MSEVQADPAFPLDDELCTWPQRPTLFTRANAVDQWPKPITPLTQELVALPQERCLDRAFSRDLGVSKSLPPWGWNAVFHGWFTYSVEAAAEMADNLPGYSRRSVYADYLGVAEDPDAVPVVASRTSRLAVATIGWNFLRAMRRYPRQANRYIATYRARLDADLARDWRDATDGEILARLTSHVEEQSEAKVPQVLANVISGPLFQAYGKTVARLAGADEAPGLVMQSMTALEGIHLQEATWAMRCVAEGTMTRDDFLAEFGFRGPNEFELMALPWRDDPENLQRLITAVARGEQIDLAGPRDEARRRIKQLAGWRWPSVRFSMRMLETHMRWRENGKVPAALATHSLRLIVREAADRLVMRGRLDEPSDVYFLRAQELFDEIGGAAVPGLKAKIAARRHALDVAALNPLPELIDVSPGVVGELTAERCRSLGVLAPKERDTSNSLHGIGAAPGVVTGPARIVRDPYEVEIEDGDVIFAEGTDSAWTPLFYQAAAVVVDIGGPMSHAAIAAREVGIACVMNVKTGTQGAVVEGQSVTVDGAAGTVILH